MKYPEEFKARVLKIYDSPKMREMLETGNSMVGRYLDDGIEQVSARTILAAKTLEELQERARIIEEERALYGEWCDLYYAQRPRYEV